MSAWFARLEVAFEGLIFVGVFQYLSAWAKILVFLPDYEKLKALVAPVVAEVDYEPQLRRPPSSRDVPASCLAWAEVVSYFSGNHQQQRHTPACLLECGCGLPWVISTADLPTTPCSMPYIMPSKPTCLADFETFPEALRPFSAVYDYAFEQQTSSKRSTGTGEGHGGALECAELAEMVVSRTVRPI